MSASGRIASLTAQHAALEDVIRMELLRPLPDTDAVKRAKARKLRIKDEIEILRSQHRLAA